VAIYLGLLAAVIGSAVFSMLHAYASINLGANQIISGTAINLLAASATIFLARVINFAFVVDESGEPVDSGKFQIPNTLTRFDIPVLSDIPFIGPIFFSSTYGTTWLVLILLLVVFYVVRYTPFGLRLRACGEHPHAVDAAGISVAKVRYMAVGLSGALAGLGGAIVVVTYRGEFDGSMFGLGFLSLAALIFGQWKSFGVLGATALFGFAITLSNSSIVYPAMVNGPGNLFKGFLRLFGEGGEEAATWWDSLRIPPQWFFDILPYLVTLLALIFLSKSSRAPKAIGEPFDKGKR
jgi:ABC-type uncharacterized transport system permease subunit